VSWGSGCERSPAPPNPAHARPRRFRTHARHRRHGSRMAHDRVGDAAVASATAPRGLRGPRLSLCLAPADAGTGGAATGGVPGGGAGGRGSPGGAQPRGYRRAAPVRACAGAASGADRHVGQRSGREPGRSQHGALRAGAPVAGPGAGSRIAGRQSPAAGSRRRDDRGQSGDLASGACCPRCCRDRTTVRSRCRRPRPPT